ncbi:hypothetical protein CIPAW_02G087100 [Carya illinoinensis]|uniref:Uncharacterized protein n=2 Tax=Carya illinoinensis TaxID=32201 RepID=A0A8T1REH6_CARIL|nr:hypothetical protein CIPAW_02G087100 [Carya illinoinensis]
MYSFIQNLLSLAKIFISHYQTIFTFSNKRLILCIIRMASFSFYLLLIIMGFMASPLLSLSSHLDSKASTIPAMPPFLKNPLPPLSPFQELSPDITPLLPSPGGVVPASSESSVPTIPSTQSPPNPDELASGPDSEFLPLLSTSVASTTLVSYLNAAVYAGSAAYWSMLLLRIIH